MKREPTMHELTIRKATAQDCGLLLQGIKGLAEYLGHPEEVTASEEDLKRTLFTQENEIEVRLAFLGGKPAGFILFYKIYSTFKASWGIFIEDLFLFPEYRNQGIGKKLFLYVIDYAKKKQFKKVEWHVSNQNTPAANFYRKMNARKVDSKSIFYLTI